MKLTQQKVDYIATATQRNKNIHGCVFQVTSADSSLNLVAASGNLEPNSKYYIASINKFVLSFITHKLAIANVLSLEDKVIDFFPENYINQLITVDGKDYTNELTIGNLVCQTSGLPCYLIDKNENGNLNMDALLHGTNDSWPLDKVIKTVRSMPSKYKPGTLGKANYSETNFRLLGSILEAVTGKQLPVLLKETFQLLGMHHTEVLSSDLLQACAPIYHKQQEIKINKYWDSTLYDISSTVTDQIALLKGFFGGKHLPMSYLQNLQQWNKIFFPFKYGCGMQQFYIPRILSPFKKTPLLIGHCGSIGSVAFYVPEKSIFIAGTVNQTSDKSIVFKSMLQIVNKL